MVQEFALGRGKAIINFSSKFCDNRRKILTSYAFARVVESFVLFLKRDNQIIYEQLISDYKTDDNLTSSLMEAIRFLSVMEVEELIEVNNKYAALFKDKDLFLEVIELLYEYWRKLERIAVVQNPRVGNGMQNVRFIQAYQLFNELLQSIYRRTRNVVNGYISNVYLQATAGVNAGLIMDHVSWNCPIEYKIGRAHV